MESNAITLSYQNENDRAYGLAGMAISVAALDAIDRGAAISIDADGPMVTFANEYYFSGSPSVSTKAAWEELVRNFQLTSAMVIGNGMARSMVRGNSEVQSELMKELYDNFEAEGKDACSLEADEVENLYNRLTMFERRIFGNRRLYPAINEFARIIELRRTLSGMEILDELRTLQLV